MSYNYFGGHKAKKFEVTEELKAALADVKNLKINETEIPGDQSDPIDKPDGGDTVDTEARAAINSIIDALEAFGVIQETTEE